MERLTLRKAMQDLREEFLSAIYEGYKDHKMWDAREIQNELHGAMYLVAMDYLGKEDSDERPRNRP